MSVLDNSIDDAFNNAQVGSSALDAYMEAFPKRRPSFSDPRILDMFRAGYGPTTGESVHAANVYDSLDPAGQVAVDTYIDKKLHPDNFKPVAFDDASVAEIDGVVTGNNATAASRAYVQRVMDSGTAEERDDLRNQYNQGLLNAHQRDRWALEMAANPDAVPALAQLTRAVTIGDSLFRRTTNAVGNGLFGSADTIRMGLEAVGTMVYYNEARAAYAVGDAIDYLADTNLVDPEAKKATYNALQEVYNDVVKSGYTPDVASSGMYEGFMGALGSFGVFIAAGSISPAT